MIKKNFGGPMIDFSEPFSGIGGFRLGLTRSGPFRCVWSCDNNRYANITYIKRFRPQRGDHFSGDIRRVPTKDIPNHDLLTAGFPCQAFSIAGKRLGFEDTRGTLFYEIARIVHDKKPSLLLLENVPGLLNHENGETFATILRVLEDLGYWVEWQILNSRHFGSIQGRERIFIIAHLREGSTRPIFPIPCTPLDSIKGDIIPTITKRPIGRGECILIEEKGRKRWLTPIELERFQGFPDNWTKGVSREMRGALLGNAVNVKVIEDLGKRILSSFTNYHAAEEEK